MSNIAFKLVCLFALIFLNLCACTGASAEDLPKADRLLVVKSERKLYLFNNGQVLREYTVSLGLNPIGHKQRRGDKRTPEGRYVLNRRNPQSQYYKSLLLSYPNEDDRRLAEAGGLDPGGDLAIHGLPTRSEEEAWDYIERDWTDGCIAVTNDQMEEIWQLVDLGTPIEIKP